MADPFNPKFVDLVRNFTTTTGTGNIVLGSAVSGHSSLAGAVASGERFYYCMVGVDKPAQREIGRGTMTANGTIAREPIGGAATNFTAGSKTIALVAAAEWFRTIGQMVNDGGDSLSALTTTNKSSLLAAVNEVSAAAAAASAAASAAGSAAAAVLFVAAGGSAVPAARMTVETGGYASPGAGSARYIFDAAVNAAFVNANPRTAFLAADGRGFRLDPSQRLTIEMFGAVGDFVSAASPGTDNLAGINAATEFLPKAGFNYVPRVHWQGLGYYVSGTIEVNSWVRWVGEGSGGNVSANTGTSPTRIIAPVNTVVLRNHHSKSTPTGSQTSNGATNATCSMYEGISFEQATQGTDLAAHGFVMRGTAQLYDCAVRRIAGNGIHIRGSIGAGGVLEGDCNNWVVADCFAHTIGGDALHIDGNDCNAGYSRHFKTAGNTIKGCGIYESSSLGNVHISPQMSGYGDGGVSDGVRRYVLIADNEADIGLGSTTTPGTNPRIWYDAGPGGATAAYPLWVSGTAYSFKLPILMIGDSNASTVLGGYEEVGSGGFCHGNEATTIYGGNFKCTDFTNHLHASAQGNGLNCRAGIGAGYRLASTGSALATNQGTYAYTKLGSPHRNGFDQANALIEHRRQKDGEVSLYLDWEADNLQFAYMARKVIFSVGGPTTARTHGRTAIQPYYMTFPDLCLQDSPTSTTHRTFGLRSASPSGDVATGDYFFRTDPSGGQVGWSIKAGGNPAVTVAKDYLNERSSPSVGIGYVALAGGAVTQATSKVTSVTLNTVCGAITMNAASLAANGVASFTLTSSAIAATDVVNVAIKSGATAGAYAVTVDAVAAGSCRISVRNLTIAALAEAIVLNFAVIKAVAA